MLKTKFLLPAAAALLALAACSKTETIEAPAPNAIGFNVLQDNALATKGTVYTSSSTFTSESFKVWGFSTSNGSTSETQYLPAGTGDIASGLTVSYSSSNSSATSGTAGWGYSGSPYYWPNYALNFYAIWPGKDGSVVTTASTTDSGKTEVVATVNASSKQFTYTVPTDVSKQLDVMTAYKSQSYDGSKNNDKNVDLKFNHALSQIIFSAKTSAAYLSGKISSITLNNIDTGAGATYTIQTEGEKAGTVIITDAQTATTDNYTADLKAGVTFDNEKMYSAGETLDGIEITNPNNELILFPQTLTSDASTTGTGNAVTTAPTSGPYVAVAYTLTDTRNNAQIASSTAYIPLTGKWESGKKYNYTLTIGPGAANVITFTATVSDWVSDSNPATEVSGTIQ